MADLSAFDAGCLPPDKRTAIERHLAECDKCGRRLNTPLPAAAASTPTGLEHLNRDAPTRPALEAEVPAALANHPRYHLLDMLGQGGMGVVYKARHHLMDRIVALKVPHRHFLDCPGFAERFHREARAAARLTHPNIVLAHDAEQVGDTPFLVMEYVPGTSLDRLVARRGPLPVGEACDCVRQAALGLQHAHEYGMIHRDVKPGNLLRTPAGQIKVLDFGLAQLVRQEEDSALTTTPPGIALGTPDYTAPEQSRDAHTADARADVYSLGCTLYFLLTGQPPFPSGTLVEKILAHQHQSPPTPTQFRGDVPASLAGILARMLAKNPAERPQSAAAVARLLAPFAAVEEDEILTAEEECPVALIVPERPRWVVPLAAAMILLGMGAIGTAGLLLILHGKQGTPTTSAVVEKPPVAPTEAPPVVPVDSLALATPEQVAALKKERRAETLAWVQDNIVPPSAPIVQTTRRNIDKDFDNQEGYQVLFTPELVRSGRAVLLSAQLGGFFNFSLTDEQARRLGLRGRGSTFEQCLNTFEPRRATPRVRLSKLSLDPIDARKANAEIVGSVVYRVDGPALPKKFAVRLRFGYGKHRYTLLQWFLDRELAEQGELAFHRPLPADLGGSPIKPFAMHADMVTEQEVGLVIESNTAAVLADSAPPPL
jgi:serine/threonine protein kinase